MIGGSIRDRRATVSYNGHIFYNKLSYWLKSVYAAFDPWVLKLSMTSASLCE